MPPLEIEHAHPEGDGAVRDLAADLAQTDQPERRAVQEADAADAAPVRIRRMPPVERLVDMADLREPGDGDAADEAVELARLRQHQRQRVLGAGDVGAPADGEHGHVARGAGGSVDRRGREAVFLHEFQLRCGGKLLASEGKRLDRCATRLGECGAQFLLRLDQLHPRRKQPRDRRAYARAVVVEIGLVREEILESRVALGRRVRIEHHLQHAQEPIVFDGEQGLIRHGAAQGWCGSGSICSAWPTRVCML